MEPLNNSDKYEPWNETLAFLPWSQVYRLTPIF